MWQHLVGDWNGGGVFTHRKLDNFGKARHNATLGWHLERRAVFTQRTIDVLGQFKTLGKAVLVKVVLRWCGGGDVPQMKVDWWI